MTFTLHLDQTFIRDEIEFYVVTVGGAEKGWGDESLAERRPERWRALLAALDRTRRPTIIYTMSQNETERLATELVPHVGNCLAYHAGLPPDRRRVVESEFLGGECDVIVATNAFGMGIDKADIRSVIHWSLPATPEALYQEAGRAARGLRGERAQAILIFHPGDIDQAYRTARSEVPVRWEIERVDRVLREMADIQGRSVVTITDRDLAHLAQLRPSIPVRVLIAHLERAGLVREVDRHYATMTVRRTGHRVENLTSFEEGLLSVIGSGSEFVTVSMSAMVGLAGTRGVRQVAAGLRSLVKRGLLEQRRSVAVRLLVDDPDEVVQEARAQARRVWKHLKAHAERHGEHRFDRSLAREGGNAHAVRTAVEVLAAFGLIEVRHDHADGSVPRARVAQAPRPEQLQAAFDAALALTPSLGAIGNSEPVPVERLCSLTRLSVADLLGGLSLLHIVGAASVDLRSWEDMPPQDADDGAVRDVAREIAIVDVPNRDDCLEVASAANLERGRLARLRLETLRRYAQIERRDEEGGRDVYQAYLEQYLTEPDFLDRVAAATTEQLVETLTPRQREIVEESATEPIVILAGPGTGKTRTLVTRIAYRVLAGYVLPERVLAVTFTRAATAEMRARLATFGVNGVDVRTLDSLAMRIVAENWSAMGFAVQPDIVDKKQRADLLRSLAPPQTNVQGELRTIDKIKAQRHALSQPLHLGYQAALVAANRIDFQDAKAAASRFLRSDDNRSRMYLERFDEVYVDEYQDLSPLQSDLADAIAGLAQLTIVGDPRQAIYEWNGAEPDELIARADRTVKRYDLVENFRSSAPILALANEVIAKVLPGLAPVVAAKPGDGSGVDGAAVATEHAMLDHVVQTVRGWLALGTSDREIAVLARTNAMVAKVASALRAAGVKAHEAGLPHVATTHAFAVLAQHANSEVLDPDFGDTLVDRLDRIRELEEVMLALAGRDEEEAAENEADWVRVRDAVNDVDLEGGIGLLDALAAIRRSDDGPRDRVGVTVATMSSSKGLEWDAVAVTGLGAVQMLDTIGQDETCRVVYVAVTRARRHLDLSFVGLPTKWLP